MYEISIEVFITNKQYGTTIINLHTDTYVPKQYMKWVFKLKDSVSKFMVIQYLSCAWIQTNKYIKFKGIDMELKLTKKEDTYLMKQIKKMIDKKDTVDNEKEISYEIQVKLGLVDY